MQHNMLDNSLTNKTLKNISYNMIGFFLPMFFLLVITPKIITNLGTKNYGVYMYVLAVSSLMGLFDFGLGHTLIKYIAEYKEKNDHERIKKLISTFNIILFLLGFFGLIIYVVMGFFATYFFLSMNDAGHYYIWLFFISGLTFFISTLSTTYTIVPVALQRFDISTKIGLINLFLSNISILILVLFHFGLRAIFISQLFFAVLLFFEYRFFSQRLLPEAKLNYKWHKNEITTVFKFSLATYISNAANSALTYLDRLLIPIYLGPTALSYYSVPGNINTKTPNLINNVSAVMFPMISSLNSIKNIDKIKNIYCRVFNLITVITFAISISIILFANKILLYWLNADFAEKSTGILIILSVTYYFLSLAGVLNSFLMGLSKTGFLLKTSVIMTIINVILLVVFLPFWGIEGAAYAYLISVLPVIYMFYYTEKKYLNLTGRWKFYLKLYFKLFIVLSFFSIIVVYLILPFVNNLQSVVIAGPLSVLLFIFLYGIFGFFEKEDIDLLNKYFKLVLKKIKLI